MKKLVKSILCSLIIVLTACTPNGPEPPETCIDEIQNQTETGIDCGGPCVECFDCFSDYCIYLSGNTPPGIETSKTWKCTHYNGEPFTNPDLTDLRQRIYHAVRFKFKNKGQLEFTGDGVFAKGNWSFDDPENPTKIYLTFPPDENEGNKELVILNLQEKELEIEWFGAQGKFAPE